MGFELTEKDRGVLAVVHPDLETIVLQAAGRTEVEFIVFEGIRTLARQKALKAQGASKTLRSRHLTGHAVDLVPLIDGRPVWDRGATITIAAAVMSVAHDLGLKGKVRWGGDWDRDGDYNDERFYDGPHFELERSVYGEAAHPRTLAYLESKGSLPPNQLQPVSKYSGQHKTEFAAEVQKALNEMGLLVNGKALTVDGYYGDATRHGVRLLQKALKVEPVDGLWGTDTGEAYRKWKANKPVGIEIKAQAQAQAQPPLVPAPPAPPEIVRADPSPFPYEAKLAPSEPAPPSVALTPESHPVASDDKSTRPVIERDEALDAAAQVHDEDPPEITGTLKEQLEIIEGRGAREPVDLSRLTVLLPWATLLLQVITLVALFVTR